MTGPSRPLYDFLRTRFADHVVLTFAQVEDLLGSELPPAARTDAQWWTGAEAIAGERERPWVLARRTATPNLRARTVSFDREPGA